MVLHMLKAHPTKARSQSLSGSTFRANDDRQESFAFRNSTGNLHTLVVQATEALDVSTIFGSHCVTVFLFVPATPRWPSHLRYIGCMRLHRKPVWCFLIDPCNIRLPNTAHCNLRIHAGCLQHFKVQCDVR